MYGREQVCVCLCVQGGLKWNISSHSLSPYWVKLVHIVKDDVFLTMHAHPKAPTYPYMWSMFKVADRNTQIPHWPGYTSADACRHSLRTSRGNYS